MQGAHLTPRLSPHHVRFELSEALWMPATGYRGLTANGPCCSATSCSPETLCPWPLVPSVLSRSPCPPDPGPGVTPAGITAKHSPRTLVRSRAPRRGVCHRSPYLRLRVFPVPGAAHGRYCAQSLIWASVHTGRRQNHGMRGEHRADLFPLPARRPPLRYPAFSDTWTLVDGDGFLTCRKWISRFRI